MIIKSLIHLFPLIPSVLCTIGLRGLAQDPANIQSVNLRGFEGCSSDQQRKIQWGWDDAIDMAKAVKDINYNEAAAVEYLGPPGKLDQYKNNFRDIFNRLSTFGEGGLLVPIIFKWDVYVRCDDPLGTCKKNGAQALAHATNRLKNNGDPFSDKPRSVEEHRSSTPIIVYCNPYFDLPRLKDVTDELKNAERYRKLNVDWYRGNSEITKIQSLFSQVKTLTLSKATVTFHEMMHADVVVYEKNGDRSIYDLSLQLKSDPQSKNVYGPWMAKVLARADVDDIGRFVTSSADNLALYALAKTIQNTIGDYPHLPMVKFREAKPGTIRGPHGVHLANKDAGTQAWTWDDSNQGIFIPAQVSNSPNVCDNLATDSTDEACQSTVSLEVQQLLSVADSQLPADYVAQWNSWFAQDGDVPLTAPGTRGSDDPNQQTDLPHRIRRSRIQVPPGNSTRSI